MGMATPSKDGAHTTVILGGLCLAACAMILALSFRGCQNLIWLLPLVAVCITQPDAPERLDEALRKTVSGTKFGSKAFDLAVQHVMCSLKATVEWQPTFGPSEFRIGLVTSESTRSSRGRLESIVFWPSHDGVYVQVLDELEPEINKSSDGVDWGIVIGGEAYRFGDRIIRCGWATNGGNWDWPIARIYKLDRGKWTVITTVQAAQQRSSIPGTHFLRRNGEVDPNVVVATMQVYPEHLAQSQSGPLLRYDQTWVVQGNHVKKLAFRLIPTPVSELERLASLVQTHQRRAFHASVPKACHATLWKLLSRKISVCCVGTQGHPECHTLSVWNDGIHAPGTPDITLKFVRGSGKWNLVGLTQIRAKDCLNDGGVLGDRP